jgi:hypothetical protein
MMMMTTTTTTMMIPLTTVPCLFLFLLFYKCRVCIYILWCSTTY